jgi:hypothetical protein
MDPGGVPYMRWLQTAQVNYLAVDRVPARAAQQVRHQEEQETKTVAEGAAWAGAGPREEGTPAG